MITHTRSSLGHVLLAALIGCATARAAAPPTPPAPPRVEEQPGLVALLRSKAPPADKALACKRLAMCGTADAVPALAPLLADPHLASWARIALEVIPGPAADAALRTAAGMLEGDLLVGVINSIGIRRDPAAFDVLSGKLGDPTPAIASAAAVALARTGAPRAAATLEPLLATAPAGVRCAVAEGLILCAERSRAAGDPETATRLYDAVRQANVSRQKTVEAIRGAILARGAEGVPLLLEQLRSTDPARFHIGLHTARELPGPEATRALAAELDRSTPARKPHLLLALADRAAPEALPAAIGAAKAGPAPLRRVAVTVLERHADPASLEALIDVATDADPTLAQAARDALVKRSGKDVDAAALTLLGSANTTARLAAIDILSQRRAPGAVPELLKSAEDPDNAVAAASLKALGELADTTHVPALLSLLLRRADPTPVEGALSATCARLSQPATGDVTILNAVYGDLSTGRSTDVTAKLAELVRGGAATIKASNAQFGDPAGGTVKQLRVEYSISGVRQTRIIKENDELTLTATVVPPTLAGAFLDALPQASPRAKPALLRILANAGGPKALDAVRAAVADPDPGVAEAARRALCDWQTPDALPDVTRIARSAAEPKWKILALRAQVRLIPLQDAPAAQRFAALEAAMAGMERIDEKRLALAALGQIHTTGALSLAASFLATDGLREEAALAAVAIAETIVATDPAAVAAAMAKVSSGDPKLTRRARQLMMRARRAPAGR